MASEHETRAPHPPLYPRLQATRFKLQESNIRSGRIPVVFDELSTLVAEGGATGIDECINEAIEAITQELHLKQKQQLKVHQLQCKSLTAQPCSPQAIKHTSDNKSTSSSPRRSPARQAIAHSATFAKSDDPLPSEDVLTHCLFCVAACQESKQRRERSLATIMNPLTGNELSPGGALPMRTPVATCDRCNGGVCEFHIMLHSVKMPGHWDALTFYDSAVDSAYRSLPPHAQLLSRVMLSIDTIRKRAAQQKLQVSGSCNPYNKNRDVYKRDAEWDGSHYHSFEISSVLARCASMIPLVPKRRDDDSLSFESKFESGNLSRAERIGPSEYVLYLREDINLDPINGRDKCYNQWFYFRVDGMQDMRSYTFHICNMYKAKSLFQVGMHVLLRAPESDVWFRGGSDYMYKESTFYKKGTKMMYQLSFRVSGPHSSLYVAAAQPYTYTDLCTALSTWQGQDQRAALIERRTLCKTLAGNPVEFCIITDPNFDGNLTPPVCSQQSPSELPGDQRPWIIVCGRVHPSECNSSWFVHGLIEFLSDPRSSIAKQLRQQFVWLVIPMINPDGVICGNSRCNLAGLDLNRCWANPSESTCPTIFHAKALLQRICPQVNISLFLDVHGHSRKRGAFLYGNRRQHRSVTGQLMPYMSAPIGHEVKVPQLLAKFSSMFSLPDCTYTISRNKMGTARYVMFDEFQLINSFTLEISMFAAADSSGEALSSTSWPSDSQFNIAASESLAFRDTTTSIVLEAGVTKHNSCMSQIPRHFEADDFMHLSRDFAVCLSSDTSWMVDPINGLTKMTMSSDSSFIYAPDAGDYIDNTYGIEDSTYDRQTVIKWLSSRGISVLASTEQRVESRLLADCKSIKGSSGTKKDLSLIPIDPNCAELIKLLLNNVRAHHELLGEEPKTCASVKSYIMRQLRTHAKQTDIGQLKSVLRALADWIGFVIDFNSQDHSKRVGTLEQSVPKLSETSYNSEFASLAAVQRYLNNASERLQFDQGHIAAGQTSNTADHLFQMCATKDPQATKNALDVTVHSRLNNALERLQIRQSQSSVTEVESREIFATLDHQKKQKEEKVMLHSQPVDPFMKTVSSANLVSPQDSLLSQTTSCTPSATTTSQTPFQTQDGFIKPWSLSFSNLDTHNSAQPSQSLATSMDVCSQPPFGSRIRERILKRRGARPDAIETSKRELLGAETTATQSMHVVSLDASNIFNSLQPVNPPLPVNSSSSQRRIRVAGALPFPHQQHQFSQLRRQVGSFSEQQHQQNGRCNSGVSSKPPSAFDVLGGGLTRVVDISILPRGGGSTDNLWSLPSTVSGIVDGDSHKYKESAGNGEQLVLKQPPVTTVQPFGNEKLPPKNASKPTLRPSTYK